MLHPLLLQSGGVVDVVGIDIVIDKLGAAGGDRLLPQLSPFGCT
jgi:hypothetical protein